MRHKVQGCRSLFDGDWSYGQRMGKHPELPSQIAKLLKQQKVNAMSADSIFS